MVADAAVAPCHPYIHVQTEETLLILVLLLLCWATEEETGRADKVKDSAYMTIPPATR